MNTDTHTLPPHHTTVNIKTEHRVQSFVSDENNKSEETTTTTAKTKK